MSTTPDNVALYRRFLDAFNANNTTEVTAVIAPSFTDHHPGFDIDGRESYLEALAGAHDNLQIQGELLDILPSGDKVTTRVRLTGKHVGPLLGVEATGKDVSWETNEIWRAENGVFVERWAVDDLLGLRAQIGTEDDNVALAQRVSDVVNARQYDAMDELFSVDFVDHNPAWSVQSLDELKGIIRAAHEALDFTANLDALYAAGPDRVNMHITFTGRHIAPFFGIEPTGKEVTWTSLEVYHMVDNKVVERWVQADTTGLMAQIGVPLPG